MKPDFKRISKYYQLPKHHNVLAYIWRDGPPNSVVEALGDERITIIYEGLANLTTTYSVADRIDDLFYLIITHDIEYLERFNDLVAANAKTSEKSTFAKLLLAVHNAEADIHITVEEPGKSNKVKVEKPIIDIVKVVLKSALTLNNTPFSYFGIDFLEHIMDVDGLRIHNVSEYAKLKSVNETVFKTQLKTQLPLEFCLSLLPYLNNETTIRKNPSSNFSDQQLDFLFSVCKLLGYEPFDTKEFIFDYYKGHNYLRNALMKYIKKLKANRNQSRHKFNLK